MLSFCLLRLLSRISLVEPPAQVARKWRARPMGVAHEATSKKKQAQSFNKSINNTTENTRAQGPRARAHKGAQDALKGAQV